jgi:hypothetical protein
MMRPFAATIIAAFALMALEVCAQTPRATTTAPFYDTTPWMSSLRASLRGDVARLARVTRLDLLPRYELALTLDANGRAYTLNESLWFTNTERAPMRDIVLRVYGNAVRAAAGGAQATVVNPPVRFVRGQCEGDACTVTQEAPSVLVARLRTPLAPGGRIKVQLELEGTLPEIDRSRTNILAQGMESLSMLGAGESSGDYGLLAKGEGITSLANFYATLARRDGGRWEREDGGHVGDLGSDDLANVHATIDTPAGYTIATTGITLGATTTRDRVRSEVAAVAVRDFCVMASRELQVATRRVGDVEVRSHFLAGDRAMGERVLDVAAGALDVFERRFGVYPYADLDVVEAPLVGGAGGVEFPGLVTVASMFYHPMDARDLGGGLGGIVGLLGMGDTITQSMNQMLPGMIEFVTAHEVAHQYWHGLVGSNSRHHPFIDESLAQWSAALYLEDRYGTERARRDADLNVRMNYQFMRMLGEADGPVDRPTSAFTSPMRYAGLVYGKGPYLYNALREAAGDAAFFRALRRYVNTWRFRTAPPTGFVDALIAEAPNAAPRFRTLARRWLHETHGDDDLGEANLSTMLGGMLGGNGGVPPELQQMLQTLGPMLSGPRRGSTASPPTQRSPQRIPSGNAGSTDPDVQNMLQELLRNMGEAH